ncbi:MAG: hypothetical protein KDB16_18215 [Acidimicrobiales bacterium]|nr:hypothetical protein [Acidimicrobiales bacterium]
MLEEAAQASGVPARVVDETPATGHRLKDEAGQATAEYALVTGVVALVVGLAAAWAAGTGKVSSLLDAVFDGLVRAAG